MTRHTPKFVMDYVLLSIHMLILLCSYLFYKTQSPQVQLSGVFTIVIMIPLLIQCVLSALPFIFFGFKLIKQQSSSLKIKIIFMLTYIWLSFITTTLLWLCNPESWALIAVFSFLGLLFLSCYFSLWHHSVATKKDYLKAIGLSALLLCYFFGLPTMSYLVA